MENRNTMTYVVGLQVGGNLGFSNVTVRQQFLYKDED
jgi:hypothetical protein